MDYAISKAFVNAIAAILARENPGLVINNCCPGWVNTDMGSMVGAPPKKVTSLKFSNFVSYCSIGLVSPSRFEWGSSVR